MEKETCCIKCGTKLKVIKIKNTKQEVYYCKKCKLYLPKLPPYRNQKTEERDLKYLHKAIKRNIRRRYGFWPSVWRFFKQLGIYFGIIIALAFLFSHPISLAILCGTAVLIILIIELTY